MRSAKWRLRRRWGRKAANLPKDLQSPLKEYEVHARALSALRGTRSPLENQRTAADVSGAERTDTRAQPRPSRMAVSRDK